MTQTASGLRKADTPQRGDAQYDPYLTNFSVAYEESISDELSSSVFPTVTVERQSGNYWVIPRGQFLKDQLKARGMGKEPELIEGWTLAQDSYFCEERSAADVIDDRQRNMVTTGDMLEEGSVRMLTNAAIIRRERDFIEQYMKPSVWATDYVGVSTVTDATTQVKKITESGVNTIRFFDDLLEDFAERTGYRPNVAVVGTKVYREIVHDPEYIERVKYSQSALPGAESNRRRIVADVLGLDKIVVPRQVWNVAKEGQATQLELMAPKNDIGLFYAPDTATANTVTAGVRFAWTGLIPEEAGALSGTLTNRIERDRLNRAHSDWFAIFTASQHKRIAADLGIYIRNLV